MSARDRLRQVFAGRQDEARRIGEAMAHPGLVGVALIGEEGAGKSRLLVETADRADPAKYRVLHTSAIQATSTVPFGALSEYLPPGLLNAPFNGNALRLAAEALRGLAGRRRLVLVNDDTHLLDEASAALAYQLARRNQLFLITTLRHGQSLPRPVVDLWTSGQAEWLEVSALTRDDVEEILVATLAGDVDGLVVQRCWESTGGNALLLRELLTAQLEAQALTIHDGVWRLPGPFAVPSWLVGLVEERLRCLPAECRPALELLAFGEPIRPALLTKLVPAAALEAAEAHGLIRVDDDTHLAYPLYGDVLRASTPRLRAQRWRDECAAVVGAGDRTTTGFARVAAWRLGNGREPCPDDLPAATRGAWSMMDLRLTEALGRRAVALGQAAAVAEPLGYALLFTGRPAEAEAVLRRTGADRVRAFNLFFGLDRVSEADTLLPSASDAPRRALLLAFAGQYDSALRLADETPDEVEARLASGLSLVFSGNPSEGVKALSADWPEEAPWLETFASIGLVHGYLWTSRTAEAEEHARESYDGAVARRWHFGIAVSCLLRSLVARVHGDPREEMRWSREGISIARDHGTSGLLAVLSGQLAHAQALTGETRAAVATLAEAERLPRQSMRLLTPWLDLTRAWLGGKASVAGAPGFEAMALHDMVRLGTPDRAVRRLRVLASATRDRTVELYAAHATAVAAGDPAALAEVSAGFELVGRPLLAAEAAAEESDRHRRAGQLALASAAAARALILARQCEVAVHTPALSTLETPQITRRENEVAELAASGLSSKEISSRLVLSVRTVENHLQRVYRKLGIGTRAELGALRILLSD